MAICLPSFALIIGVGAVVYRAETRANRMVLEDQQKQMILLQRTWIVSDLTSVASDLTILTGHHLVQNVLEGKGSFDPETRANLNQEFLVFADSRKLYDQVRLLDEKGMETARVNFNSGNPLVVPDSELQTHLRHLEILTCCC